MIFYFRLFFLFFIIPSYAISKDSIVWYYPNFPPSHIVDGPYKGQGLVVPMYKQIFPYLNEYNHKTSIANFKRLIKNIRLKTNTCGVALLRNSEREKVVEYSVPYFIVHPVRLIINEKDLKKFEPYKKNDNTYSLNEILKDEKLYLGYSNGRSYSKVLDNILEELVSSKNSMLSTQSFILGGLLKMLTRDRIDYTLGYVHEVNYLSKSLNIGDKFITLTIYESNDFIPVYIGCPKNDWGRKIINRLNPFLLNYRASGAFYNSYLKWLDEEALKGYEGSVKKYFNTN